MNMSVRYNPVRFIDAFVDKLDLKKLGLKHSVKQNWETVLRSRRIFSNYTSMATLTRFAPAESLSESARETLNSSG